METHKASLSDKRLSMRSSNLTISIISKPMELEHRLGDPIEVGALSTVFRGRKERPL